MGLGGEMVAVGVEEVLVARGVCAMIRHQPSATSSADTTARSTYLALFSRRICRPRDPSLERIAQASGWQTRVCYMAQHIQTQGKGSRKIGG